MSPIYTIFFERYECSKNEICNYLHGYSISVSSVSEITFLLEILTLLEYKYLYCEDNR